MSKSGALYFGMEREVFVFSNLSPGQSREKIHRRIRMSFLLRRILIAAAPVVWRKIQQRRRRR